MNLFDFRIETDTEIYLTEQVNNIMFEKLCLRKTFIDYKGL